MNDISPQEPENDNTKHGRKISLATSMFMKAQSVLEWAEREKSKEKPMSQASKNIVKFCLVIAAVGALVYGSTFILETMSF